MEAYSASLTADYLRVHLLQAHAHAASSPDPLWEIYDLEKAVTYFAKLAEQMPAVEARLAQIKAATIEEAA